MIQAIPALRAATTALLLLLLLALHARPSTASAHQPGQTTTTTLPAQTGGSTAHHDPSGGNAPKPVSLKMKLPFPAGTSYEVIQGNHGTFTHTGSNSYAWDFALPENAPVCAAADGRVVRVKQDGKSGGASHEYFSQGNTIVLDHGKGLFTQYLHLAQNSARVREGDLVRAGQIIALSGNTGFSSMPHLHFQVQDARGRSLPAVFQDVPGGLPQVNTTVTSGNDGTGTSAYAGESHMPSEAFHANSITLLTRNLPAHIFRRNQTYKIRGRITPRTARQVVLYFMSPSGGKPLQSVFATVDKDGFFQLELRPEQLPCEAWSDDRIQSNMFSLAMAPVADDGSYWSDVSVPVCIR